MRIMRFVILFAVLSSTAYTEPFPQATQGGNLDSLRIRTALLRSNNDAILREVFPHRFLIFVEFDDLYPRDYVLDRGNYRIREKKRPDMELDITEFEIRPGYSDVTRANAGEIFLFGDFLVHEDSLYQIVIALPHTSITKDIGMGVITETVRASDTAFSVSAWLSRNIHLKLDLEQIGDTKGTLGVDYHFGLDWYTRRSMTLSSTSNGIIGSNNHNTQNSLTFDLLSLKWRHIYESVLLDIGGARMPSVNAVGIHAKPLEVECTAKFDTVDYAGKIYGVASVPLIFDRLVLWWHRVSAVQKGFLPPTVYAGVTVTSNLTGKDTSETNLRYDFGWIFNFPIFSNVYLRARQRFFYAKDEHEKRNLYDLLELSWERSVSQGASLIVKYANGSLPPTLRRKENVSLGFSISFN